MQQKNLIVKKTTTSLKFLLDANLSPLTAEFLRNLNFDAVSILEQKLHYLSDEDVVKKAKREGRIIITFDQDFVDLWYFREKGKVGIMRIRTKNQTPENVNKILKKFFESPKSKADFGKQLVVIKETGIRISNIRS